MLTLAALSKRIGHTPRRKMVVAALLCALGLGAGIWGLMPDSHTITVYGLGEPISFKTTHQELSAALRAQGIILKEKDVVQPGLTTDLRGQQQLTVSIRQAVPISVVENGQERRVETAVTSVKDLLQELQIKLGDHDRVSLPLESPLNAGMQVRVIRRSEQVVTSQEEIPFETISRDDASLRVGTSKVIQAGEPGQRRIRHRIETEDGQQISSQVIDETVTKEPVAQIVAYGTQGVVSRGGREYRYTEEVTMMATGYTAGKESNPDGNGLTYTGMRAERGVVAVDPSVIPLYTRLYIEGYGPAIAADIGGAIKGNKIDLCFDTVDEALQWGIRPVKVYILTE